MDEFPFPVTIKAASLCDEPQTIMCMDLLRGVGEKRKVFDAKWGTRPVIVKVFAHPIKAKYHMQRDWRGLKLLQERNLNSPTPLFYGRTARGQWAIVTEKITDASDLRKVWNSAADPLKRRNLLSKVGRELAGQHAKGVLQKDLHLGNFLLQGEKLFALDPAQMRFASGEIGRKRAIAQLALLASTVPEEDTGTVASFLQDYLRTRSWEFGQSDMARFWKKVAACRKKGLEYALKKCLRTNKRHQKIKTRDYIAVATRDFFERADFCKFMENIDELMQKGQILKKGNTCFVSRINLAGKEIVVKRYNHKGIIHSTRHTIKRSRARRSWLHAHRLRTLNIATPRPVAYIEQRKGILVWKSYLVTEFAQGKNLHSFLHDTKTGQEERSEVAQQLTELIGKLGKYRITHGDLKYSNILITERGPVLTDLDAVVAYKWNWAYKIMSAKDLKLFSRDRLGHSLNSLESCSR